MLDVSAQLLNARYRLRAYRRGNPAFFATAELTVEDNGNRLLSQIVGPFVVDAVQDLVPPNMIALAMAGNSVACKHNTPVGGDTIVHADRF